MLKPIYENMPDELKQYLQWVNWRAIHRKKGSKPPKPPFQPNGKLAKTDDPTTWSSFSLVAGAVPRFNGVGVVLTREDDLVALDYDNCRCPAFDGLADWANSLDMVLPNVAEHIRNFDSYAEKSPSGRGIRQLVKGKLPVGGRKKGDFEVYQYDRYVTLTGHILDGFPRTIEHRQMQLDTFYKEIFGDPEKPPEPEKKHRTTASPVGWTIIREKAFRGVNGAKIERLWNGDHSDYPSPSEADMALCAHLAYWLSGDPVAIDAAFRESGLYRKKWDEKHYSDGSTYGEHTIKTVAGNVAQFRPNTGGDETGNQECL
jgi:putative DNA primase/helicase